MAQLAVAYTRGWATNSINPRLREKSELERLIGIVALLREEIRIQDARMARISPHRRPQYQPVARIAILELRAAQAWTSRQTAKTFLVTVCPASHACCRPSAETDSTWRLGNL